jgi:hypothetical protein
MVEFFDVRNADEASFRRAWAAAAPVGAVLYRALLEDVQPRYAALSDPPGPVDGGVLLLAHDPIALEPLRGRQGFIAGRRDGDVTVIHWSSPLMVARARTQHSIPGALYVHETLAGTQPQPNPPV